MGEQALLPPIDRKRVWACQNTAAFTKELLRLVKSYEKCHPPIILLAITRGKTGKPVGVEIATDELAGVSNSEVS